MDIDGFLLPANNSFKQGQQLNPVSLSHSFSSNIALAPKKQSDPRLQNNRSSERRTSISTISPFKSPSLSSWPQAEVMYSSRSQTLNRSIRSESSALLPFSSSFERLLKNHSPISSYNVFNYNMANDSANIRKWSRISDTGYSGLEQDKKGLESFMKLINRTQELNMFQQKQSMFEKENQAPTNSTLSHFRYLQESYTALSVSISLDQVSNKQAVHPPNKVDSLVNRMHDRKHPIEPPSPLKTIASSSSLLNHHCPSSDSYEESVQHFKAKTNRSNTISTDGLTTEQVRVVTNSPLRNRKAPPVSPPKMPQYESGNVDDDDDSLVFEMSEICDEEDHFLS
ncbi:hypothetical protein BD560DRAFT_489301 [Blakeslea trispora]|nr:hypothetical protein BD560DRAFT_489301 [Blakeslea trispora]